VLDDDAMRPCLVGRVEVTLRVARVSGEGGRGRGKRDEHGDDRTEAAGHTPWIGLSG